MNIYCIRRQKTTSIKDPRRLPPTAFAWRGIVNKAQVEEIHSLAPSLELLVMVFTKDIRSFGELFDYSITSHNSEKSQNRR